jgi:hypothetical protein
VIKVGGTNPVATLDNDLLAAGKRAYLWVSPGDALSVMAA